MLTPRGWWLLIVSVVIGLFGTAASLARGPFLALLGWTVTLWVLAVAGWFVLVVRRTLPRLAVEREVHDDRGPVETLWADRRFTVVLRVRSLSRLSTPWLVIDDRFPVNATLEEGQTHATVKLRSGETVELRYRLRCAAPGALRFEGLRLRAADAQGFCFFETFRRVPKILPVLPTLADVELKQRTGKRQNTLVPPGVHRWRRSGSGSELLDLRDYRPGDSPKLIAWKVTARKDKLITKEFESEVPIRCTLIVDASNSMRLGPPGRTALAPMVEIASAVTQAALARRDLVGLLAFDESDWSYIPPARSRRQLLDILRRLGELAARPPRSTRPQLNVVRPLAEALIQELFPDLLQREVNSFSFLSAVWSPRPEYLRRLNLADAIFPWRHRLSPTAWREEAQRKRLAAVLTHALELPAGSEALIAEDDDYLGESMQELLARHEIPYTLPLWDSEDRSVFFAPEKIEIAAAALLRAVRRGRDNELFVMLADLWGMRDHLEPLRRSIRVAVGRHHRIVVITPWPWEISSTDHLPSSDRSAQRVAGSIQQEIAAWYQREFAELRRDLGRLGVPVLSNQQQEAVPLILERMEQLRVGGIRR